jgi:hypothetical protein
MVPVPFIAFKCAFLFKVFYFRFLTTFAILQQFLDQHSNFFFIRIRLRDSHIQQLVYYIC